MVSLIESCHLICFACLPMQMVRPGEIFIAVIDTGTVLALWEKNSIHACFFIVINTLFAEASIRLFFSSVYFILFINFTSARLHIRSRIGVYVRGIGDYGRIRLFT